METKRVDQIPITDERLKSALHLVRTAFAEWMLQEFSPPGTDCLQILAAQGLCSQQELDDAIGDAEIRIANKKASQSSAAPFGGSLEDAEEYLSAEMERNLQQALVVQNPGDIILRIPRPKSYDPGGIAMMKSRSSFFLRMTAN